MIPVTFTLSNSEKTFPVQLADNLSLADLKKAIPELGDLSKYRILIDDKQLCLDNETIFNRQKQRLIHAGVRILLLPIAPGGSLLEFSLLKEILLEELKQEWPKVNRATAVCDFCLCQEQCATIHCSKVCIDCFPNYLEDTNFELRCTKNMNPSNLKVLHLCGVVIDYRTFFKTPEFIDKWSLLCEVTDLVKNIDCQICYCGALLFNMTMYSKQQCSNCQRWLCFFCNRNWNDQTMSNAQFTCRDDDCEYQRRLAFELVNLERNKSLMVPDRRCCPKCSVVGGYGMMCKYHVCPHCKHQFCFICLETQSDCNKKYGADCDHACTAVKKQDYSMFPRINGP